MYRKEDLYIKATALRSKGFSYNEILRYIPVAQGTISRWCHNIPLTEKQKKRLIEKRNNNPLIRSLREKSTRDQEEAKIWAGKRIEKLPNTEQLLLVSGTLLYWAEGTKSKSGIEFTNTDPKMIKVMMKFLRKILCIPNDKFKIMVRLSDKGDIERAKNYWSRITKISQRNFRKSEILKLKKNSKSINRYPYGLCRVIVHDISAQRKIRALIEKFPEKILVGK